jgi:hypothetical protein
MLKMAKNHQKQKKKLIERFFDLLRADPEKPIFELLKKREKKTEFFTTSKMNTPL